MTVDCEKSGSSHNCGFRHAIFEAAQTLLLFGALTAAIVAITWPWAAHITDSFADHWDPPLHAWKVRCIAEAIMHGRLLPPGTSLNAFYPNPGSLFYESLYWPQALVAAPVLAFSGNPVLAFHVSYLFFWALSGIFFRLFLKEIGLGRAASLFGAFAFVLIPYRTGYLVEFNMQLCFGLPLCLLFLVRWSRKNDPLYAALAALAICLQAASEMYTAVFFSLCLPFILAALWAGRWRAMLHERKTAFSIIAAVLVAIIFTAVFFWPFLGQLGNSVSRQLPEIFRHQAEPLSYLCSSRLMRWRLLPEPFAKQEEICLYPTLAVLLAATCSLAAATINRIMKASTLPDRIGLLLRFARAGIVIWFLAVAAVSAAGNDCRPPHFYMSAPVYATILSLAIPFFSAYRDERDRILDALCSAALFAFFMSLGPFLFHKNDTWRLANRLYLFLYGHLGFMQGFRVVSRFGIEVSIFLVTAACIAIDRLQAFAQRSGCAVLSAVARLSAIPLLLLLVIESVPRNVALRKVPDLDSPVLRRLDQRGRPFCIQMLPAWKRYWDSMDMFTVGETHRLLIASWGGAIPPFSMQARCGMGSLLHDFDGGPLRDILGSVWPECLVLLDCSRLNGRKRKGVMRAIAEVAEVIDDDDRFILYRFRPTPPTATIERFVRPDFVAAAPICRFSVLPAHTNEFRNCGIAVSASFDGVQVFSAEVPPEGASFSMRVDPSVSSSSAPDVFRFQADAPFSLASFELVAEETGGDDDVCAPYASR